MWIVFSPIFLTETIFFSKIWGSKKGLKVAFFVKNSCYAQNGVNGVSLGPKSRKWFLCENQGFIVTLLLL